MARLGRGLPLTASRHKTAASRLLVLDAFRALAALYVVAFHFLYRWSEGVAESALTHDVSAMPGRGLVAAGFLGVEFFFLISGFVIALTLQRCNSFGSFAWRRATRLVPAMLLCAVATLLLMPVIGVAPFTAVETVDLLPSLLFLDPWLVNRLTGLDTAWVSGVYWSLFEEVKFYALAATLYFLFGRRLLLPLALAVLAMCLAEGVARLCGLDGLAETLRLLLIPTYGPLFLSGVALHSLFRGDFRLTRPARWILLLSGLYAIGYYSPLAPGGGGTWLEAAVLAGFYALFLLLVAAPGGLRWLRRGGLPLVGAASYPLYLLHESVGVSLVHRAYAWSPVPYLWQAVTLVAIVTVCILMHLYVEKPVQQRLRAMEPGRDA
jgi:peptidoglycan/LPS O-acetylase OafA/YrhL